MLRTRLATAAVAIPGLWLIFEYLPAPLFNGFVVAVVALGLYEYFGMALPGHTRDRAAGVAFGMGVAAGVVWGSPQAWGAMLAVTLIAGFTFLLLQHADLAGAVHRLGVTLLGVIYVGFFTPHVVLLRGLDADQGWRWGLFAVFVAMGSDSGGYFAGRALGRHRLAPSVSPGKTVEGALGAVAGAVLVAWLCRLVFSRQLGPTEALALGAVIGLLAQLGDLCESVLKRAFGAKDSGWIIPGHGGILDRLDSLLFPIVFVYYYAAFPRA
jgi:phosphatidate cytidylyltransferase